MPQIFPPAAHPANRSDDMIAQARRSLAQGAVAEARRLADTVLALDAMHLPARLIANQAAFIAGDYRAAMAHVDAGLQHAPNSADLHLRRARCLIVWNDPGGAKAELDLAKRDAINPADGAPAPWGMIGDAFTLISDFAQAMDAYGQAIAFEPAVAQHWFNRAVVARYLGDSQQAAHDYEQAIALAPDHSEARLNLVHLTRQTPTGHRIAAMETRLRGLPATPPTVRERINLHYALAKTHEDLGDGAASFAHLDAGARLQRGCWRYDVRADLRVIAAIVAADPADAACTQSSGFAALQPIFVLGLPRSGSTLIERILTAHASVGSIGESPAFGRAIGQVAQSAGIDPQDGVAFARDSQALDPAAIGQTYAELIAPWRGSELLFVDKLPNNHLHAGLIARALPDARIVHVMRDPVANLYGMYKTLFNQAYPYSYDLDELVAYYAAYLGLMAHWRAALGPRLIEVQYEDLIASPEPVIRKLVADCGLDWQPACLAFHENPRPCTTQSASQIRAPLNRDGIEGQQRFAAQLALLRDKLAQNGLVF